MKLNTTPNRLLLVTGILLVCGILIAVGSGCTGWGGWGGYCWGGWGGCCWNGCGGCGGCGDCGDCDCQSKFYIKGCDDSGGQVIIGKAPPIKAPELPSLDSIPEPPVIVSPPASVPVNAPQAPSIELPTDVPDYEPPDKPTLPSLP